LGGDDKADIEPRPRRSGGATDVQIPSRPLKPLSLKGRLNGKNVINPK
jgi:hypothetical protein